MIVDFKHFKTKTGEVAVAAEKVVFVIDEPQGVTLQFANGRTIIVEEKFELVHNQLGLDLILAGPPRRAGNQAFVDAVSGSGSATTVHFSTGVAFDIPIELPLFLFGIRAARAQKTGQPFNEKPPGDVVMTVS